MDKYTHRAEEIAVFQPTFIEFLHHPIRGDEYSLTLVRSQYIGVRPHPNALETTGQYLPATEVKRRGRAKLLILCGLPG
jgi:hypothetical protein